VTCALISFAAVAMQLAERGYRPFPGLQETKRPAMKGWNGLNAAAWDLADLAAATTEYLPPDDYCCCLAIQPELVAIDLDITEPSEADHADRLADAILELSADSEQIPAISRTQLDRFTGDLFKVVPRRLMPNLQGNPTGFNVSQTVGERLRMLTTLCGSWKHAAAIILGEATEGCRNETGWAVVASAAGRGIPEDVVWQLFRHHFVGWGGFSESDLTLAIARTRRSPQPMTMTMTFGVYSSLRGGNVGRRQSGR